MKEKTIPDFDSIHEMAHFWETHDLTDFDEDLEEVREPVFKKDAVFKIHLPPDEAEAIKQLAKSKGIPDAELVRKWVLERIHAA